VTIQMASLSIEPARLQGHLLSPDLFDVPQFPTATFESTRVVADTSGRVGEQQATHAITGTLTLHGQARTLTFPAIVTATDAEVAASAEFVVDRREFGIVYPGMPDDLIRDEVVIRFRVRAPRS
jgi:polyisoprenoid-binding protein YceI